MSEAEVGPPIPVLVVGPGAQPLARELGSHLAAMSDAGPYSCAAFDTAGQAADASTGASHVVLIALGPECEDILADPVWIDWTAPGSQLTAIAVTDSAHNSESAEPSTPSRTTDAFVAPLLPGGIEVHRLSCHHMEALPVLVRLVARLQHEGQSRRLLSRQLATERACEPLADCLEPGKLYSMAIDLLLNQLGRNRGIALFAPSPAPRGAGVAARGFDDEMGDEIRNQVLEEKAIEAAMGQGEVSVVPWGPLHHVLGRVGVEAPGSLLSVPLRGEESEIGHVWILGEGRRFDAADLAAARTIARRASAALSTAERYHHAKERAFIDDVTGVFNARYLLATADNEIQRAARYGNPLSVLFLDLDRFKGVNDRFGHLVGSDTLRALSELLGQCVRQVDTLARYGGDEFTILLVDTDHETALRVAERIRSRVEAQVFEAGREGTHQLTISIGVATCPEHGDVREILLDAADKAMYRAKSWGRNKVCSADDLVDRPADPAADASARKR
jgi:two-component system cell cycle response regulator